MKKACDKGAGPCEPPAPPFEFLDPLTTRVFRAFGRVMHLHRLVMVRNFASRGIHPQEAFALHVLRDHGGMTQRELGQVLHLSPPRVSMVLRSLERAGAVERRVDQDDRRVARVFLTAEGERREQEQRAFFEEFVSRTLGSLSEGDKVELERLLGKVAEKTQDFLAGGRAGTS